MRVLDPFHVVRLGLAAVDDVRQRIQQQTYGHRGRADDPLYRIRRVLRRGAAHLTDTGWARLMAGMDAVDEGGQVAATWVAAQELRAIYSAARAADDLRWRRCVVLLWLTPEAQVDRGLHPHPFAADVPIRVAVQR